MDRFSSKVIVVIAVVAIMIAGMVFVPTAFAAGKRVIVVFDPASNPAARRAIVQQHGCSIIRELSIVPAVVVLLPDVASDSARDAIMKDSSVIRIEDDAIVQAYPKPENPSGGKKPPVQPAQTLPWGVDQIDAELAWGNSTGLGVKVGVVDTGIDVAHPDLVDNLAGGVNIINPRKLYNDDNGHGTHVAGIIAAANNSIGVVGVANKASLYGVKVLDRAGNGWLSDVIAGLEWCVNNAMDVVNMSLGSSSDSSSLYEAVVAVKDAGIVQVASAGNEGGPVSYPAAYPQTIAVAATDSSNSIPSWSNSGPQIDLAAPGVAVRSTYKGGVYAELSGTSMAAPHVAGVAALILENKPDYTPDEVLSTLTATADNLGYDPTRQGAGLADAEEAALVTN